jgi:poly-gamma-glutamate capsule biosynthesis protein CapA/YwtB (metallophosphatase superfamily)
MKSVRTFAIGLIAVAAPFALHAGKSAFVEDGSCKPDPLRWLWDSFTGPVTSNWAGIVPLKRHEVMVPESERGGLQVKRIVMFGDMVGMSGDTPPVVHEEVRAIYGRADLVIGNIESPLTTYRKTEIGVKNGLSPYSIQFYNFHMPRQFLRSLTAQYCIDPAKTVFSVANNHANDRGDWAQTLPATQALAESDGFRFAGIDDDPAHEPRITVFDSDKLRVGVVSWTHLDNTPPALDADGSVLRPTWQASRKVAYEWDTAANTVDTSRRRDFTQRKKALGLDMLIGMPHWGCEFQSYPKPYQVEEASLFSRSGFDLIAGSHPGVMQPAAFIGGDRAKMVFYSLGVVNKIFNWFGTPALVTAVELLVDENGRPLEYTVHPFIQRVRENPDNLPAVVSCPGGRTATDFPRVAKEEIVTLERAYKEAGPDKKWATRDIDTALRVFNTVIPE